jgi:hypothetical protein
MNQITNLLNQCTPFIRLVALLFGITAAVLALADMVPIVGQIWRPKGSAQTNAIIAAALAIVSGNR